MWKAAGEIILLCSMMFSFIAGQDGNDGCPKGWLCNNENYYKYISTAKTWVEAEIYCQSLLHGAHLASVHSLEENNYIQQLVWESTKSNPQIWMGASDCYKDRTFMWTDGTAWDFQKWNPGEPNNYYGREPCMQSNFDKRGMWNDQPCAMSLPFVCKLYDPLGYIG